MESKTKLLDYMRLVLRLKPMSFRTEEAYVNWARRFLLFHHKRHPKDMGAQEIRAFLGHLAVHDHVAASTQHVVLNALLFLSRHVLTHDFPDLVELELALRLHLFPTVFTREEVTRVLAHLTGMPQRMASLLYGAGLRLMACGRLRVKARDVAYHHIVVHDGKGVQERVTMLPPSLGAAMQRHLAQVQALHARDLAEGYGAVSVPYALERTDPGAGQSWMWQ
jgi:integrase